MKRLEIFGHKLHLIKICCDRVYLTCCYDCCHDPHHLYVEMNLSEYNKELKKQEK